MAGEVDPEVADLLGIGAETRQKPDFNTLFGDEVKEGAPAAGDITREKFTPITKIEENPKPYFADKDYYKKVLVDGGELSKKVHVLLTQFLGAQDSQDRSLYRGRLIPIFWDLVNQIAQQIKGKLSIQKRILLRFGVLSPTFLSAEQRNMISTIVHENKTGEPIYYVDEWMDMIGAGRVNLSATDEVRVVKKDAAQKNQEIIEKRRGQQEAELSLLQNKITENDSLENTLLNNIKHILNHNRRDEYGGLKDIFSPDQRKLLGEIPDLVRKLGNTDREMGKSYSVLDRLRQEIDELSGKVDGAQVSEVDTGSIKEEFNTIRQMAKLCVGRQGNHVPILMRQYLRGNIKDICTRENVINELCFIESLDPLVFDRTFKGQTNRIVPHIILIPCYGDQAVCWEPFERRNRATSRGRIAIPLFPKDVREAVISAVADLRWQVAKEIAQHYWMEEGITGRYYQWFSENKLKGDVKDSFIRDYILWLTKESVGTQKLDREVRGIFWRNMPFPQPIKDDLKNRGFVYSDLYKKDANIARSDGY
ncbi:MAG TPA: hypothetical protein VMX75_01725 [Spirochaetia bacterium]|nr:hypothetical protein [Spirochaetia bacterium]